MTILHRSFVISAAILGWVGSFASLDAQTVDHWSWRVQAGRAEINAAESGGIILSGGVSRKLALKGLFRMETDVSWSGVDEGFFSLSGGLEFRHSPAGKYSPFARVNVGFLNEPGYSGPLFTATGGILYRVEARTWLLIGALGGTHGDRSGPRALLIGVERGFGEQEKIQRPITFKEMGIWIPNR